MSASPSRPIVTATFGRPPMQRVHLPYIYEIAVNLEPLKDLKEEETQFIDVFVLFLNALSTIRTLFFGSVYAPFIRSSVSLGSNLIDLLRKHTEAEKPFEKSVAIYEIYQIKTAYANFKVALLAEIGSFNSYIASQKAGYDMYALLETGEVIFPDTLLAKAPECRIDAREAAKALAYELPTACGFHAFRVTESVLRRYYFEVTNGAAAPKVRSIGVYINALKIAKKGEERILSVLKQMADLHRNPLIHPEVVLTTAEAIAVLGMSCSVVTAMLSVLPDVPQTTSTAV